MKNNESEINHKLEGYCRRFRSHFKNSKVMPISSELAFRLLIQNTGVNSVKNIIRDIEIILKRNGDAGKYLVTIVEPLIEHMQNNKIQRII